jgi:spermidine synthase
MGAMKPSPTLSTPAPTSPRFLPLLLFLFLGSGCAALIYEIVWLQLLQLVIGASAVSLGVLLGTFMGGMCLGSLLLARFVPERVHPLRVYGVLELLMAVLGVTVLVAVPVIGRIYAPHAGAGLTGLVLRGVVAGICLLPPTFLMGATLPAISRWVQTTPLGMSWLGLFYGGNTVGAVCGCLLAGFYLLRVYDMATATYIAAAINALVAACAFALSAWTTHQPTVKSKNSEAPESAPGVRWVYVTIALSGMTALAAEVVWTRLLSLMLGGTVYAFSIILGVFLAGLGLGSTGGSLLARGGVRPRVALGWCQIFLAAAMGWAAWALNASIPFWPVNPSLATNPAYTFQLDLVRCLWALLPATILWGASFPLALAAVAARGNDPGRLVGRVYAANTVGAIVGALVASLLLIAWIGTQYAQQVLIGLAAISGVIMLVSSLSADGETTESDAAGTGNLATVVSLVIAVIVAGIIVVTVPPVPWKLIALGRYMVTYGDDRTLLFMGEGMNSSVAVTKMKDDGTRNFHVSGKVEASTDPQDMRLQRMLGHLPGLIHPNPRSVLVVGCGAGVTAGSFLTYPEVTNVTICELEPLIPKVVAHYFNEENYGVVTNSRVKIVFDDARHFVLTTHQKFDIITSDPIHPWVKGAATLYTKDYFELVKQHLNPGGLVTQWVPLYESDTNVVKSELATFFAAFPNGTVWNNDQNGQGYDTVVMGGVEPLRIDLDMMEGRLLRDKAVAKSLSDVGFSTIWPLLTTYGGRASDMQAWLADAQINRDSNLRLQYLAGMASDLTQATGIADSILSHRTFPPDMFVGDEQRTGIMREIIEARTGHAGK